MDESLPSKNRAKALRRLRQKELFAYLTDQNSPVMSSVNPARFW